MNGPTPILHSGSHPTRGRKRIGGILVTAVIGGFLVFVQVVNVDETANPSPKVGSAVLIVGAALAFTILTHELGHLVVGWLVGFRFGQIRVGPLQLHLKNGKLNLRLLWETTGLGEAGMRTGAVARLRRRLVVFALAGSGTNVLSVPIILSLANQSAIASRYPFAVWFAADFAFISILLAIVNLMPTSLGPRSASDGARIATFLSDPKRGRRHLAICAVQAQHNEGIHAKNWKQTWLRAACSVPDGSIDDFWGNWFAYASASARNDKNAAAVHLEQLLRLSRFQSRSIRDMAALEAASFSAWFLQDANLSDKWLAQVNKPEFVSPFTRFRLFIGRCCARRDFRQALQLWGKELTHIIELPGTSVRLAFLATWLELREQVELRQSLADLPLSFESRPRLRQSQDQELQQRFGLTAHEGEIVSALVGGYSNKELAEHLNLHDTTVECQLRDVFDKLGSSSRFGLTANKSTRTRRFSTVSMLCGLGGLICAVMASRMSMLIVGTIVGMTVMSSHWTAEFLGAMGQPRGYIRRNAMETASMFAVGGLFGSLCIAAALGYFHRPFLISWFMSLEVLVAGGFFIATWRKYHDD